MLLVQLQPRKLGVEQEFVIKADGCIKDLLGIDSLKITKCVPNLQEKKFYSIQFLTSIPLTTEKTQGVQVFAKEGVFSLGAGECRRGTFPRLFCRQRILWPTRKPKT